MEVEDLVGAEGFGDLFEVLSDVPDVISEVLPHYDFSGENIERAEAILEAQRSFPATRRMEEAEITSVKKIQTGTDNSDYISLVELGGKLTTYAKFAENRASKQVKKAKGNTDRLSRVLNECSAYYIACLMGRDYASLFLPLILRKYDWRVCSLVVKAPGKSKNPQNGAWQNSVAREQLMRAALFDALAHNRDRYERNFLVNGKDLYLIDHECCFNKHAPHYGECILEWRKAQGKAKLTPQEVAVVTDLTQGKKKEVIQALLGSERASLFQARADKFLKNGSL